MATLTTYNATLNRVEISFTRPPGSLTKFYLSKFGFEYLPELKIWVGKGRRENEAGRIVYTFECEQEQTKPKTKIIHG